MELAAPGNQILLGNHQFYNGTRCGWDWAVFTKRVSMYAFICFRLLSSLLGVFKYESFFFTVFKDMVTWTWVSIMFRRKRIQFAFTSVKVVSWFLLLVVKRRAFGLFLFHILRKSKNLLKNMFVNFGTVASKLSVGFRKQLFTGEIQKTLEVPRRFEDIVLANIDITSNDFYEQAVMPDKLRLAWTQLKLNLGSFYHIDLCWFEKASELLRKGNFKYLSQSYKLCAVLLLFWLEEWKNFYFLS